MNRLEGKIALITGASRGIGPYIVRALSREGALVIGIARNKEKLINLQKHIIEEGGKVRIIPFDLKETHKLKVLVQNLKKDNMNRIDILVNNAGIEKYTHYADNDYESIQSIITVNLLAPMELTRLILPEMLKRCQGNIINIASLAGRKGVAYNSIYSASKAGIIKWGDGLRQELNGTGVSVSTIMPGYIDKAGMFFDCGFPAPKLLGTSLPQKVADAVIKAIKTGKGEIIVNSGPMKPLLALNVFAPEFGNYIVKKFGVVSLSKKRIK